jgi:hypothetical protein
MALRFGDAPWPKFSGGWEKKAKACGQGVAILRTCQCPYFEDATALLLEAASGRGLAAKVVELVSPKAVRERAPSPFGTYSVVIAGRPVPIYFQAKEAIEKAGRPKKGGPGR